jgi:hypothetical protein
MVGSLCFPFKQCIHYALYLSAKETYEALRELEAQGNAEFLRPLFAAIALGPLSLLRDEALVKNNHHSWSDNALYMVCIFSLYSVLVSSPDILATF